MSTRNVNSVFTVDTSQFKKGITEVNNALKLSVKEFKATSAGMDNWQKSTEGIRAKLSQLSTAETQYTKKISLTQTQISKLQQANEKYASELVILKRKKDELRQANQTETEEYKNIQKQIKATETALESNTRTIERQTQSLKTAEVELTGVKNESNKWREALNRLEAEEGEVENSTNKLNESIEDTHGISSATIGIVSGLTQSFVNLASSGISRAIDGLKQFVDYATEVGTSFEETMSNVKALSSANVSESRQLSEEALAVASKSQYTATETADALSYMAMAGWKTEDMLSGLSGITTLAAASGADLAETSDIVTDTLTAFGKSAKDAGTLADIMAAASANSNTNVSMLGETFKYASTLAGAYGYSMEDVAVATGLMANSGIKATQAGTTLRSMFSRWSGSMEDVNEALEQVGVQTVNADGSMKPLGTTISELREAFKDLSDSEKSQYATTIAGKNAMSGFLAIVNSTDADFKSLTESINNCDGAADTMSNTMMDNFSGSMQVMQSNAEATGIAFFEKFQKPIREVVDNVSGYLQKITSQFKYGRLGTQVNRIAQEIANLTNKLIRMAVNALPKVLDGIEWILNNKDKLINGLKTLVKTIATFKILKTVTSYVNSSKTALSLLAGIVTKNTTAVSGLISEMPEGTSLLKNFATVSNNAGGGLKGLLTGIKSLISPFSILTTTLTVGMSALAAYDGYVKSQVNTGQDVVDRAKELVEDATAISESIESATSGAKYTLSNSLTDLQQINELIEEAKKLNSDNDDSVFSIERKKDIAAELNNLLPDIQAYYDETSNTINWNTEKLKENTQAMEDNALQQATQQFKKENFDAYREANDKLRELIGTRDDLAKEQERINKEIEEQKEKYITEMLKTGSDVDMEQAMKTGVLGELSKAQGNISSQIDETNNAIDGVKESMRTAAVNYSDAENIIRGYNEEIQANYGRMLENATKTTEEMRNDVINNTTSMANEMVGKLASMVQRVSPLAKSAGDEIVKGTDVSDQLGTNGENAIQAFCGGVVVERQSVAEAGASIKSTLSSSLSGTSEFVQHGMNIVAGIRSGIESAWSGLTSWFSSLTSTLAKTFQVSIDSHSPSKVFAKLSQHIPEGIEQGIEQKAGVAYKAINNLSQGLQDNFNVGTVSAGMSGGTVSGGVINQTFNQYNTSPKALDIKTQYRQTRNLLEFAGRKR